MAKGGLPVFVETFVQGSTVEILLNFCARNPPYCQASTVAVIKTAMTSYQIEINRSRRVHYSNKGQIQTVIGTRLFIKDYLNRDVNMYLSLQNSIYFVYSKGTTGKRQNNPSQKGGWKWQKNF